MYTVDLSTRDQIVIRTLIHAYALSGWNRLVTPMSECIFWLVEGNQTLFAAATRPCSFIELQPTFSGNFRLRSELSSSSEMRFHQISLISIWCLTEFESVINMSHNHAPKTNTGSRHSGTGGNRTHVLSYPRASTEC